MEQESPHKSLVIITLYCHVETLCKDAAEASANSINWRQETFHGPKHLQLK